MRYAPPAAAMAALVVCAGPARGELRILKSNGQPAAQSEATLAYDEKTGGWNVTLKKLYAPGDWTSYDIRGDGGETIDNVVIDVPCWEDNHGNCIPAGSPVVVRVLSDGEAGVRTVRNIVQTGTAETLLNRVDVREDVGAVEVEVIGIVRAGRDVIGPVRATTRDNPLRGINRLEAERDVLGDVSAELGVVMLVLAYGRVGTDEQPVVIRGKHGVVQVAGYQGVWADINTRVNDGAGTMFALGGASFTGTLETAGMDSPYNGWPARISIWGPFEGLISIGGSFDHPEQWMEFARGGLGGQVVINADGEPGGTWTSPVYLGFEGDEERFALDGPRYPTAPGEIGGGAVGLVPFALHAEACAPPPGSSVPPGGPGQPLVVRLRHYGPVDLAGKDPLTIERRPHGSSDPYALVPPGTLAVGVDPGDARTLLIAPIGDGAGLEAGYDYRVAATDQLVCAVAGAPPVAWPASYEITVVGDAPCPGDVDESGAVDLADLLALLSAWGPCSGCPEDLNDDGIVAFGDLLLLLSAWGDCS